MNKHRFYIRPGRILLLLLSSALVLFIVSACRSTKTKYGPPAYYQNEPVEKYGVPVSE